MDYPRKNNLSLNTCGLNMLDDSINTTKTIENAENVKKWFQLANTPARNVFI